MLLYILLIWTCSNVANGNFETNHTGMIISSDARSGRFWSDESITEALRNNLDVYKNKTVRSRRHFNGFYWSDDNFKSAEPYMPFPTAESLSQMEFNLDSAKNYESNSDASVSDANLNDFPFKTYGKFVFLLQDGRKGSCTAAFVAQNILLTAAHCVRANGRWYSDFWFQHKFNGAADKGTKVNWGKLFAIDTYDGNNGKPDYRFDYAFITTTDSPNQGYLGAKFGEFDQPEILAAGFPRNAHNGQKLVYTKGQRGRDQNGLLHTPSNPMRQGSSGGPWLIKRSNGDYWAVGVTSFGLPGVRGVFSPKFDDSTYRLFNAAMANVQTHIRPNQNVPMPHYSGYDRTPTHICAYLCPIFCNGNSLICNNFKTQRSCVC